MLESQPVTQPTSVLFVEDDPLVRLFVIAALADEGYAAEPAADADEARAMMDRTRYDVLMTDIMLPRGQSGFALAAWAARRQPNLRIIYTSGLPETAAHRMVAQGSYLEKPFGARRLISSIEAARLC
ncbi:MAG: response regulator [Proteobacteria bacterium]|nr:response regulator [Pseudomonadota bacterium]